MNLYWISTLHHEATGFRGPLAGSMRLTLSYGLICAQNNKEYGESTQESPNKTRKNSHMICISKITSS